MALLRSQIEEILKSPKKRRTIDRAVKHESRLRFHVESYLESSDISRPLTIFLDWVKTLIPKDKFNIFVSLFQYPTPVIQQTSLIFNELERVFDGKNPAFNYQFTDPAYNADWKAYRHKALKEPMVWRKKGWDAVKTTINSVLIVDTPAEQTTERPEPYFYFLGIEHVIDYNYIDGAIEYIIFRQPLKKIAVFDDESYRVYKLNDKNEIVEELINNPHDLKYCPADFFWTTELMQKEPDLKKSPLSPQLANLDWLLFFSISKRHLDLYAPYPIYSVYEADCDFANNETGEYCDGGYLRNPSSNDDYMLLANGTVMSCPVCSEKRIAGAGSLIEIPVPKDAADFDMRDPVQITSVDGKSLDYNVKEVNRLTTEVFSRVVGLGGDIQEKQSLNEMQVTANFESKISILNSIKGNLEAAQKFVDDTVCKLRYGDNFLGSSISMGTEFYIFSVDELYKQYKQAKENGASEAELDAINEQILTTEYRNNPTQLERMLILRHLEPYRHYTLEELMKLQEKDILNKDLLNIKINFNSFVDRFERENFNITEFGSQLDFNKKIEIITKEFKTYGTENGQDPGS